MLVCYPWRHSEDYSDTPLGKQHDCDTGFIELQLGGLHLAYGMLSYVVMKTMLSGYD